MSSASNSGNTSDDNSHWSKQPPRVYSRDDVIASVAVATTSDQSGCPDHSDDTLSQVLLQTSSQFDIDLINAWKRAKDAGALNYSVDDVLTKTLPGKYGIVLQLNPSRRSKRRPPMKFNQLHHPYDHTAFNFNKIKSHEVLFNIELPGVDGASLRGSVIVNTAPLCSSHCLLLPAPDQCHPQLISETALQMATASVLLSAVRSYRVGFNSLCAYASVNHCHFHAYHLDRLLNVETAECRQLCGPCHVFVGHYAPGFVFQVTAEDVQQGVSSAMKLINHLSTAGIPHNVFITRGLPVAVSSSAPPPGTGTACASDADQCPTDHDKMRPTAKTKTPQSYEVLRICVWARKSSGETSSDGADFYAAVCELAGHVPVYSSDVWENIKEETITQKIFQACESTFNSLLSTIEQLYS